MGMLSEMSIDLLDEKSVCLLSDAQINRLITVLTNARDRRKEEVKNKAIQDFYNTWLKLRELDIIPRYVNDDEDHYYIALDDFNNFNF